jgi:hypothetical protein
MLNSAEIYRECGRRAGKARLEHDEARARHEKDWFRRAQRLEREADRPEAQRAFDDGYASVQPIRRTLA